MTVQFAITLVAATVGFVSAVFLCIGNALNTSRKILLQATPYYDFSKPLASSLATQKAQYMVGGLLLVATFLLQIAATLASSAMPAAIPSYLDSWFAVVLAVLVPTGLLSGVLSVLLYKATIRNVLRMEETRRQKEEATSKGGSPR